MGAGYKKELNDSQCSYFKKRSTKKFMSIDLQRKSTLIEENNQIT